MKTITYDETLWQLVPKEPTGRMESAFYEGDQLPTFAASYHAMLAAAQTPAQQPWQESEIAATALEEAANWFDEHCMTMSARILRALAAQKREAVECSI